MAGELQIGRLTRFLQKWANMKGKGFPIALSSEIAANLNIFSGAENRYLDSWDLFASGFAVGAGGAGNFSKWRIRNPVGSGVVAVFQRICVSEALADTPRLSWGRAIITDLSTNPGFGVNSWDGRGKPTSSLTISTENNTVTQDIPGGTPILLFLTNNTFADFLLNGVEMPLLPGSALQISTNVANQAANANFMWRERALEDSEKT
jgi:hypothetical protein